jgi:hypothetical protein
MLGVALQTRELILLALVLVLGVIDLVKRMSVYPAQIHDLSPAPERLLCSPSEGLRRHARRTAFESLGPDSRLIQGRAISPFHCRAEQDDLPAERRFASLAQETGDLRWGQTCLRCLFEFLDS